MGWPNIPITVPVDVTVGFGKKTTVREFNDTNFFEQENRNLIILKEKNKQLVIKENHQKEKE
ncbi:hypothetical protein BpHYR1_054455 [Brachionus plicatilis]|uniref:Uncharacterized protein n=1 Tax=Brachionus plicatilis TaxID=10195 RepID=A0A3M7R4D0_BRAPC|nr:hypothetical protein BpHYR1_054455 [Brachionus plicatilis]